MSKGAIEWHYARDDFRTSVEQIGARAAGGEGVCILFVGGTDEARREALAQIADYTSANLHQRDARNLVGDSLQQTQGFIREAIDTAGEGAALLYLENTDALVADEKRRREENGGAPDVQTGLNYLFQRIGHFSGMVILHVNDAASIGDRIVDFAVHF